MDGEFRRSKEQDITASSCYDAPMRTTLTLDPDVLKAARSIARAKAISIGAAVSELARRGLEQTRHEALEPFPHFQVSPEARIITLEDVKLIEDEV